MGDPSGCWELRVHGVANTPPESVLRTGGDADAQQGRAPPMVRSAGDDTTGFYRHAEDVQPADEITVEAFSWGQLTSGVRRGKAARDLRRAGWSLLLPFALINVALWCRPQVPYDPDERRLTATLAWLVRAMALGLTCMLMLAASGVSMDLVAWQCRTRCATVPFSFLGLEFFDVGARRALAGTVVPLLVLAAVYWLAGKSYKYEAVSPARREGEGVRSAAVPQTRLEHPDFWRGSSQIRALRLVHTGAGVATIAHALAACVWIPGTQPALPARTAAAASLLAGLALAVAMAALCLRPIRQRGAPQHRLWVTLVLHLPAALSAVALVLAIAAAMGLDPPADPRRVPLTAMPGLDGTIRAVYLFLLALLIGMLVISGWQAGVTGRLDGRADSAVWRGLATPLFAGAAWMIATLYSLAALYGAREWLDRWGDAATETHPRFAATMEWSAVGALAAAVVVVLVGAIALIHLIVLGGGETRELRRLVDPMHRHAYQRARAVGRSRGVHRFVGYHALTHVGWLAALVLPVIMFCGLLAAGRRVDGTVPLDQPRSWHLAGIPLPDRPDGLPLQLGSLFASLVFLGLVSVAGFTYRNNAFRRSVGVVWDIVTFWPRGAHPFGPPCYAERAVPQLVSRIEALPDLPLILAGHSQGSLLCAATVAQLQPQRRESTFLLTFGSQLTRLYGRAFPAFFGRDGRHRLAVLLGGDPDSQSAPWAGVRWRSLYRTTDFLGWPIAGTAPPGGPAAGEHKDDLGDVVDVAVTDPADLDPPSGRGLAPPLGGAADPPIRRHFGYPLSSEYVAARAGAARRLRRLPES